MQFRFQTMAGFVALALAGCAATTPQTSVVGDYLSARVAAYTNDIHVAADAFSEAQALAPGSAEIRRNAFYFHLAAGDYDEAMALAEKLANDPAAGDGGFGKAVLAARALKAGDYATAERLASSAGAQGFPVPAANLMEVWAKAGRLGEAAALETLRAIPGDEYRGFYPLHAALLSENLGESDDARSAFQLSVMAFSGSAEMVAFGEFLEREGDASATREYYEFLASQEGIARFVGRAGLARLARGDAPPSYRKTSPGEGAAIALYSLASGILQDTWKRREAAEKAGFRVGEADYNLSLAMARLALYLDPDLDDARRFAGSILNFYGRHEEAIETLKQVDPGSPYYEQAQIEIANAYRILDKEDLAVDVLRDAVRKRPGAVDAQLALANIYASEGRHEDAVAVMDGVIARLPENPLPIAWRYYLTRAASLLEIDRWPAAEADLKQAVEIAPEQATALNYLGYSWAERGEHLDEAFALIEKAVAIEPDSGAIIDSLGWAHYQLGDYKEAVRHLERAAALEPADPTITDHLGDVYWRLGRRLEARYQWRRVLELAPESEAADAARTKIDEGLPAAKEG